jgi:hypothetical protein
MKRKFATLAGGIALALGLVACGGGGAEEGVTTSTSTVTTILSSESDTEEAVAELSSTPPVAEPVQEELYVVECLAGTPGPSLMSDGTVTYTDYCFEILGGPAYVEEESRSGLNPPAGNYQCPGTNIWVENSSFCTPEIIGPENVAFNDGGTCAGAICGYGHNQNGQRNPTSGELQTLHGCQLGYITDSELCAAVAWVDGWEY